MQWITYVGNPTRWIHYIMYVLSIQFPNRDKRASKKASLEYNLIHNDPDISCYFDRITDTPILSDNFHPSSMIFELWLVNANLHTLNDPARILIATPLKNLWYLMIIGIDL